MTRHVKVRSYYGHCCDVFAGKRSLVVIDWRAARFHVSSGGRLIQKEVSAEIYIGAIQNHAHHAPFRINRVAYIPDQSVPLTVDENQVVSALVLAMHGASGVTTTLLYSWGGVSNDLVVANPNSASQNPAPSGIHLPPLLSPAPNPLHSRLSVASASNSYVPGFQQHSVML